MPLPKNYMDILEAITVDPKATPAQKDEARELLAKAQAGGAAKPAKKAPPAPTPEETALKFLDIPPPDTKKKVPEKMGAWEAAGRGALEGAVPGAHALWGPLGVGAGELLWKLRQAAAPGPEEALGPAPKGADPERWERYKRAMARFEPGGRGALAEMEKASDVGAEELSRAFEQQPLAALGGGLVGGLRGGGALLSAAPAKVAQLAIARYAPLAATLKPAATGIATGALGGYFGGAAAAELARQDPLTGGVIGGVLGGGVPAVGAGLRAAAGAAVRGLRRPSAIKALPAALETAERGGEFQTSVLHGGLEPVPGTRAAQEAAAGRTAQQMAEARAPALHRAIETRSRAIGAKYEGEDPTVTGGLIGEAIARTKGRTASARPYIEMAVNLAEEAGTAEKGEPIFATMRDMLAREAKAASRGEPLILPTSEPAPKGAIRLPLQRAVRAGIVTPKDVREALDVYSAGAEGPVPASAGGAGPVPVSAGVAPGYASVMAESVGVPGTRDLATRARFAREANAALWDDPLAIAAGEPSAIPAGEPMAVLAGEPALRGAPQLLPLRAMRMLLPASEPAPEGALQWVPQRAMGPAPPSGEAAQRMLPPSGEAGQRLLPPSGDVAQRMLPAPEGTLQWLPRQTAQADIVAAREARGVMGAPGAGGAGLTLAKPAGSARPPLKLDVVLEPVEMDAQEMVTRVKAITEAANIGDKRHGEEVLVRLTKPMRDLRDRLFPELRKPFARYAEELGDLAKIKAELGLPGQKMMLERTAAGEAPLAEQTQAIAGRLTPSVYHRELTPERLAARKQAFVAAGGEPRDFDRIVAQQAYEDILRPTADRPAIRPGMALHPSAKAGFWATVAPPNISLRLDALSRQPAAPNQKLRLLMQALTPPMVQYSQGEQR